MNVDYGEDDINNDVNDDGDVNKNDDDDDDNAGQWWQQWFTINNDDGNGSLLRRKLTRGSQNCEPWAKMARARSISPNFLSRSEYLRHILRASWQKKKKKKGQTNREYKDTHTHTHIYIYIYRWIETKQIEREEVWN